MKTFSIIMAAVGGSWFGIVIVHGCFLALRGWRERRAAWLAYKRADGQRKKAIWRMLR